MDQHFQKLGTKMDTTPSKASITFHDDLDIIALYGNVVNLLGEWVKDRDRWAKEYERYMKIASCTHNPSDELEAKQRAKKILKRLNMIDSTDLVQTYRDTTASILQEYMELSGGSRVFGIDPCIDVPKRIGVILKFLDVTKSYVNIQWICTYDMSRICPLCFGPTRKCSPIMICERCGHSRSIPLTLDLHIDHGHSASDSTYDSSKNFRKEYMHLCGLQDDMGPDEEVDIASYLYRAGIKDPTRDDIRDAIRATGYNNYRDTNLIYSRITKAPLPSIIIHIDTCARRFQEYNRVFQDLEVKEGTNITNLHFLIKLFLWQENIPYESSWFRTLSSNTEAKHRRNVKRVCSILQKQDPEHRWLWPSSWE